jgi:glucosamine--fructose-6-phosphate aminotransferase (isomerizing)
MCGIVGAIAQRHVDPILIEGLRRLEYRGYDSAGMALITDQGVLDRRRTVGKVEQLAQRLSESPLSGHIGIAHTRWATHGVPSEPNAHPHFSREEVAVVHNGIIENWESLRLSLQEKGYHFSSDTDTETIVNLIHSHLSSTNDLLEAVRQTLSALEGAYAFCAMSRREPHRLVVARLGSPLVIGLGIGENFVASDVHALLPVTQRFIFLEEGDVADIRREQITIYDAQGHEVTREIRHSLLTAEASDKGVFRHFMQKEIHEQPVAVSNTLEGRIGEKQIYETLFGPGSVLLFDKVERVRIVACGTSYHAGMVARYWIEALAGLPCDVEIASEFRYRRSVRQNNTLFVTISQSGETADTLAALRLAKSQNYLGSLCICNVPESSLVRESDLVLMTHAGPEIGVASTKAFTTQLVGLQLLAIALAKRHGLTSEQEAELVSGLRSLPRLLEEILHLDDPIRELAERFVDKHHALFLGRGTLYPLAMEGALKLKEISYIHAEAYPAGELKHGPLALVDEMMPVVTVAPNNDLLEKLKSNLHEVKARGGQLIVFADPSADMGADDQTTLLKVPSTSEYLAPIVYTVPLQLLAYHVAVLKGTDVDQPRNLAKSVTVE